MTYEIDIYDDTWMTQHNTTGDDILVTECDSYEMWGSDSWVCFLNCDGIESNISILMMLHGKLKWWNITEQEHLMIVSRTLGLNNFCQVSLTSRDANTDDR